MCGRFAQYSPLAELKKRFSIEKVTCTLTPSYNIAPLNFVPVILSHNGNRLGTLRWGLVPSWAKDTRRAASLINARAETVAEKPSFRSAFRKHRCLILADGFYEWQQEKIEKQPWYFTQVSGEPFAFAGVWDIWKGEDGQTADYHSCAIITTEADISSIQSVHHRMPVILRPDVHAAWLDPGNQNPAGLQEILQKGRIGALKGIRVSKRVNNPRTNDPACIEPVAEGGGNA